VILHTRAGQQFFDGNSLVPSSDYTTTAGTAQYAPSEAELARINRPVLVIWCDGSGGLGPDAGERMASLIPDARFKALPETGFWAHWEKPDEFNDAVRTFIQERA
jgi:pimeloyl-ACP methyl ester carboxylesterase